MVALVEIFSENTWLTPAAASASLDFPRLLRGPYAGGVAPAGRGGLVVTELGADGPARLVRRSVSSASSFSHPVGGPSLAPWSTQSEPIAVI
ncbi:hypothetical protein AB0B45_49885 [Nonomuraea sp. NPDC049152]|uniref:hypothetical protein n=1 Tax=Nonomuraea sp. NPDC049152 TaxID=3154350 RepID=UPI0033FA8C6C